MQKSVFGGGMPSAVRGGQFRTADVDVIINKDCTGVAAAGHEVAHGSQAVAHHRGNGIQ